MIYIDDDTLLKNVRKAMENVCNAYQHNDCECVCTITPDINKRENEIERMTEVNDANSVRAIDLILEFASLKFDNCHVCYNDTLNEIIRDEYIKTGKSNLLNKDLIEKSIKNICVKTDGSIKLKLVSGAEIESA